MIAAVWIVDFPLQAYCWMLPEVSLEQQLVLIDAEDIHGEGRIAFISKGALLAGVRAGMTIAQALSLSSDIRVISRRIDFEHSATQAISDIAFSYSPRVEIGTNEDLGWVYIDVAGLERLMGKPNDIMRGLKHILVGVGFENTVGVGETKTHAHLLALNGGGVALGEDAAKKISSLPLAGLCPTTKLDRNFSRFGLRCIGDFLALGADAIADHLGEEAVSLYRYGMGQDSVAFCPEKPTEAFVETWNLDVAIGELEPLNFILSSMLSRLTSRLSIRGFLASHLTLEFSYEGSGSCVRDIGVSVPTRHARSLLVLCRLKIESDPPKEAVEKIVLTATPKKVKQEQMSLFEGSSAPDESLAVTVARLQGLCGAHRVGVPKNHHSYQEDDFSMVEMSYGSVQTARQGEGDLLPAFNSISLRRFRPPKEASVNFVRGAPRYLKCKGIAGRVVASAGPFRRGSLWWESKDDVSSLQPFLFDLYDLQLSDKTTYRVIYDRHQEKFFVQGWYD